MEDRAGSRMQFGTVVHTEGFEAAVKAQLAQAFEQMVQASVRDAQQIVETGAEVSPVASGEMQSNFKVFGISRSGNEAQIEFGIARGTNAQEVRMERGDVRRIHRSVEEHVYPDGRHCSHDLVNETGLQANDQARRKPLTFGLLKVWGVAPSNTDSFVEGDVNRVELPDFGGAGSVQGRLEGVVASVLG